MGDKTGIQWTDATWNPFTGCTHVSEGCDNCYAAQLASGRLSKLPAYTGLASGGRFNGRVRLLPDRLDQPLRWRRPRRIFVNSMGDLFHESVDDEYVAKVFAIMALAQHHQFQVLTKRHGRMKALVGSATFPGLVKAALMDMWLANTRLEVAHVPALPLPNVWLGVSVENQHWADVRIPKLLGTPAAVRFLSCEPLLGQVKLQHEWLLPHARGDALIDWVIAGGESGAYARPMHPDWVRLLRDDCEEAGVPFFFKQWGEHVPVQVVDAPMAGGRAWNYPPGSGNWSAAVIRERSSKAFRTGETRPMRPGDTRGDGTLLDLDTMALKVGKHEAGRELDGRTWDEFPDEWFRAAQ